MSMKKNLSVSKDHILLKDLAQNLKIMRNGLKLKTNLYATLEHIELADNALLLKRTPIFQKSLKSLNVTMNISK